MGVHGEYMGVHGVHRSTPMMYSHFLQCTPIFYSYVLLSTPMYSYVPLRVLRTPTAHAYNQMSGWCRVWVDSSAKYEFEYAQSTVNDVNLP